MSSGPADFIAPNIKEKPSQETKVVLKPLLREQVIDSEGGHVGAALGKLLRRMMKDGDKLLLTIHADGEYFRGLTDGGLFHARELHTMLEKAGTVEVSTILVDKK